MAHWLTNRGKLLLMQGLWDDAGASAVKVGLLTGTSVPAAMDTEAEIQDLNTVAELLALTGVDEPVGGWYSRQSLTRSAAVEDDTNNRVGLDAANPTWVSATAGEDICAWYWYDATTDTNDTTRILCGVGTLAAALPTNGSDITGTIADLIRAS